MDQNEDAGELKRKIEQATRIASRIKTDEWEAAIPKEKRKTFRVDEEVFETDDPRWLAHRRALHALFEAESDAECDLASIVPTTPAGVCALLKYGAEVEEHG